MCRARITCTNWTAGASMGGNASARGAVSARRRYGVRHPSAVDTGALEPMADFAQTIAAAYATDGPALDLGRGVHDGAVVPDAVVKLPLSMVNRHGLIAGATGTGKTKTLQGLAEQLSAAGVPVFVSDVKGDLSGIAEPGEAGSAAAERAGQLGLRLGARGV